MSERVAWNKYRTASVVLAKLKEFTITSKNVNNVLSWEVRGWYNFENNFLFGEFETKEEATAFLETIHKKF